MQTPTWFEQNAVGLIGHGLTLLGLFLAAGTIAWQLAKQHKNSLSLQRENAREALKLQVYENLIPKIRKASHSISHAGMYAFTIPIHIDIYQYQHSSGFNPSPVTDRGSEFLRLHGEAGSAMVELIEEFESWGIAFPGIEIFKVAINVTNYDLQKSFNDLHSALLPALPFDLPPDGQSPIHRVITQPLLPAGQLDSLKSLVDLYKAASDDALSYLYDLTIEAQNNLLSNLFQRRVELRKPLDPSCKVISTHPKAAERLMHYFETDTAWGKAKQSTELKLKSDLQLD
jgi:hypothetical protein